MEFFGVLAALSSNFAMEAADPSINLTEQFLISTLFPILLNSKQLFSAFIDRF